MKVRLYAGDMHVNRTDKKVCRNTKICFFRKQNGENFFFLVKMFNSPMDYLASIMF